MAVWLRFNADWDHRPHVNQVLAYKRGSRVYVPQSVADLAVAAGRAEVIDKPDDLKSTKSGGVEPVKPAPAKRDSKEA
jgi:hypothetical protein